MRAAEGSTGLARFSRIENAMHGGSLSRRPNAGPRTASLGRPTRRALLAAALGAATVAATALTAIAAPTPTAPQGTTTKVTALKATVPAPLRSPAPAAAATPSVYAAVTAANGREYLRLVETSTGRVTATLASVKAPRGGYFGDIDLAPDGSVYAVTHDSSLPNSYQTRLRRYTTKGSTALQPYILTVKVAPDGKTLATTAMSPDGDGDGYGLESLRISRLNGTKLRDLMTSKFGVWAKGTPNVTPGSPAVSAGGTRVLGWLPGGNLAVDWGCCDSGASWIVSSTRANQSSTLPPRRSTLKGTFGTTIIGYKGASVLQLHSDDNYRPLIRWGTAKNYRGQIVARPNSVDWDRLDALARKHGATPLRPSPKTYPYRGAGKVLQASL